LLQSLQYFIKVITNPHLPFPPSPKYIKIAEAIASIIPNFQYKNTNKTTSNSTNRNTLTKQSTKCLPQKVHQYNLRSNHQCMNIEKQQNNQTSLPSYKTLINNINTRSIWEESFSRELGRLAQGYQDIKGTNTIKFINFQNIPISRRKDITYGNIVV